MCPVDRKPLAALTIDALPIPETGQRDYPEGSVGGLVLRVFESGARTWILRYRDTAGRSRKYPMGDYPTLGLAAARKLARELKVAIKNGADPLAEKRAARQEAEEGADSLGDLIDWYLRDHAERRLASRTYEAYRDYLTGEDIVGLRKIPAKDVSAFEIAAWLDKYEKRGAMTACNRAQSALSAVYTWAAPRRRLGVIANPVRGLPRRHNERGGEKRWLTADEIRTVLRKLEEILTEDRPTVPQWAVDAIFLTLATGQRPGEVLMMKWEHVELHDHGGTWRMPRGYRKRVRGQREAPAHDVPLAPAAAARLRAMTDRRGYLFPKKGGHKSTNDLNQRIQRGLLPQLEIEPFTPHDLRRTCRTHLGKMGVPQHIAKKILGHVDSSVDAVYDRGAYWTERVAALDAWAERLEGLTQPESESG